jgi:hypothetical protein
VARDGNEAINSYITDMLGLEVVAYFRQEPASPRSPAVSSR